jgi:hypothetical protein
MSAMNHFRSVWSFLFVTVILVVGQLVVLPLSIAASAAAPPTAAPSPFEVPADEVLLFRHHARGVQIYECRSGQWAFHAPRAQLFDPDKHGRTGTHYGGIDRGLTPGPWWESVSDGSRIRAGNPTPAPSPNPNSIPLLSLDVLQRHGTGMFSEVEHIHRLNTVGGVGPTGKCTTGAWRQVPYTADYYFYGKP